MLCSTRGNLSPILAAYPQLMHLAIRGGNRLSRVAMPGLREVVTATLPRLEHLELYLATENSSTTSADDDLTPLLDGSRFPTLKYLGLKNSDYQDQLAQSFAHAPIPEQLDVLDPSPRTLTDEGAAACTQVSAPSRSTVALPGREWASGRVDPR